MSQQDSNREIGFGLLGILHGEKQPESKPQTLERNRLLTYRPARMGYVWRERDQQSDYEECLATPDELHQTEDIFKHISGVARFGYQLPAYSLRRVPSKNHLVGITFVGDQSHFDSITNTINGLKDQGDINKRFPNTDILHWLSQVFNYTNNPRLQDLLKPAGRILILKQNRIKPEGTISALCLPGLDAPYSGYPPYTPGRGYWRPPSSTLTLIDFDNPTSRKEYEEKLQHHPSPLRLQNALQSIIFSPDITQDLVGVGNRGLIPVVDRGTPNSAFYTKEEDALDDMAGLGFDLRYAIENGWNIKPLVVK